VLSAWEVAYEAQAAEFRATFLADLLPFRGNPALADQFHRLFDGVEVLPEALLERWQTLHAERPWRPMPCWCPFTGISMSNWPPRAC